MDAFDSLLPFDVVKVFAESIVEGNQIYNELRDGQQLLNVNLTIPEAMDAIAKRNLRNLIEWVCIECDCKTFAAITDESGYFMWCDRILLYISMVWMVIAFVQD